MSRGGLVAPDQSECPNGTLTYYWIAAATAVGVALRLFGLHNQIIVDDEVHAIHAALQMPISEILVTYRVTDFCQPLTALFRFAMDRGVVMSELHFRAPVLLSSVSTIIALPMLTRRWIGHRSAILMAWFLALSPLLVLYGRLIRSYAPAVLLGSSAILVFYAWFQMPKLSTGFVYVLLASATTYTHLGTATFVLSPFLFAGISMVVRREDREKGIATLLLGVSTGLGFLSFLTPSWTTLGPLISATRIEQHFNWKILEPILKMQAGTSWSSLTLLFWIITALGLFILVQRYRHFAFFTLSVVLVHISGLLFLSPWGLESPQIFNRYILVLTPIISIWFSAGLSNLGNGSIRRWLFPATFTLLFMAGPLAHKPFRTSSYVHSHDLLSIFTEPADMPINRIPSFYQRLAQDLPPGPVVEYPHDNSSLSNKAGYIYQMLHGQRVIASTLDPTFNDPRLSFRGYLPAQRLALLDSKARYLVIHLDQNREEANIHETTWMKSFSKSKKLQKLNRRAAILLAQKLEGHWGSPHFSDFNILVWDLDQIRYRICQSSASSRWVACKKPIAP